MKDFFYKISLPLAMITAIISFIPWIFGMQIQPIVFVFAVFTAISYFLSDRVNFAIVWCFISILWMIQL